LVGSKVSFPPSPLENVSNRIKPPEINGFQGVFYWGITQINSNRAKDEGLQGARSGHIIYRFLCAPNFPQIPGKVVDIVTTFSL
jgi:hypothetical protein